MQDKDMSILVQVAFKEAALDARGQGIDVSSTPEAKAYLAALVAAHADVLVAEVETRVAGLRGTATAAPASAPAAAQGSFDAQASINEAFPGAQSVPFEVTAKNGLYNGTPLPAWLYDACKAVGETEVYDNREDAAGTNKPHFRAANTPDPKNSQYKLGFWPPK